MFLTIWRFTTIMLMALTMGMAFCHLLEMPVRLTWDATLWITTTRLLTNNPLKVKGLEDAGVVVSSREAHWVGENQHNADYLAVKRRKMGHHGDATPPPTSLLKVARKL